MRNPATLLAGHLQWTATGTVWATWRIEPQAYGRRPVKEKRVVRDLHRLLMRSLDGEALIMGVAVGLDPVAVVERQIEGLRLEDCPGVAAEAEANLDRLAELVLGERAYYLSVPLSNGGRSALTGPATAAVGQLHEAAGVPRPTPSPAEVDRRLAQAASIEASIPVPFRPARVTVAEQLWLVGHSCRRGMVDLPPPAPGSVDEQLVLSSAVMLPEPVLDEGAWSDEDAVASKPQVPAGLMVLGLSAVATVLRVWATTSVPVAVAAAAAFAVGFALLMTALRKTPMRNPLSRRVLKVTDPYAADLGQDASYQCPMVLTDTPQAGVSWPGSELFERLDDLAQDVDWTIRLHVVNREDVMAANRKAQRRLADQFDQRSDELALGTTDLDLAAELLGEYQSIFAADRLEVEVQHTIIVVVAGPDAAAAMGAAQNLSAALAGADFRLERPVGGLTELWWAAQPGVPTSGTIRRWSLHTTADQFSALVPFTTTRLGGRKGPVWGLNESTARTSVIHLDPGGYPELDKSGSAALAGELGGGKTSAMKSMCNAIVDEGGQLMAIDKSDDGEWARFAATFTDPAIVDPDIPRWSMDPLRVLDDESGHVVLQSFITQLLDLSPREEMGVTLSECLDPGYRRAHRIVSSGDVMEHLAGPSCTLPSASGLASRLRICSRLPVGRLVFDGSLPPVPTDASCVVWRTNRMAQPTEQEIATPHLFHSLGLDKVWGRAYYSLITATARRFAFADRTRVSVLACDEAYDIFANPANALDLEHFVRQGRRPKALLLVASHNPDRDFGSEAMRQLIPTRIVTRATDEDLAEACVRFLGVGEDDPEFARMVDELRTDISPLVPDQGVAPERRGECLLRDAFGGVGRARVLLPAVPERAAAALSTPPKSKTSA